MQQQQGDDPFKFLNQPQPHLGQAPPTSQAAALHGQSTGGYDQAGYQAGLHAAQAAQMNIRGPPQAQSDAPTGDGDRNMAQDIMRLQATLERTVKKYSDDILRVLEAVNLRMEHLEASNERLAGSVNDLRTAVVDLKENNVTVAHGVVERADSFQLTLATAAENVQMLRDKQTLIEEQQKLSETTLREAQSELARIKDVARSVALEVVKDLQTQKESDEAAALQQSQAQTAPPASPEPAAAPAASAPAVAAPPPADAHALPSAPPPAALPALPVGPYPGLTADQVALLQMPQLQAGLLPLPPPVLPLPQQPPPQQGQFGGYSPIAPGGYSAPAPSVPMYNAMPPPPPAYSPQSFQPPPPPMQQQQHYMSPPNVPPPPPPPPQHQQYQSYHSASQPPPPPPPSRGEPPAAQLSTSKVPIDKVVDDLAAMGFTKDEVRSVIRRLAESGQSVDLNVVIDKLMNGDTGGAVRSGVRSWYPGGGGR